MPQQPDIFDQAAATAPDAWDAAAASANTSAPTSASAVPSTGRDIWDEAAEGYDPSPSPMRNPVKVESSTTDKILGALAPQKTPRSALSGQTQGDLPGFEGSYASGDTDKGAFTSAAGAVSGAALAAPAVVSALRTAAASHPIVAKVVVEGLKGLGFVGGVKVGEKLVHLTDFLTGGH